MEGVVIEAGQRKHGVRSQKKIVRRDNYRYARKMLWTAENEKVN